jgi:hypothetical protein
MNHLIGPVMRTWPRLFVLLTALAVPRLAQAANSPDFAKSLAQMAAHKALYTLTLDASPKGAVVAANGTMSYEVIDSCDGWATQQRLAMDVTNSDGQTVRMVSDYSTWEAKNGSRLRFHVRQTTDTAVTLQLAGEADIAPGGGVIHYTEPKPDTVKLAAGTLFPMAHTAHIMALAQSGQKFITLPLFDGSSDTGAEDTFIVITRSIAASPFKYPALAPLPSDDVNVSFYDHDSNGEAPDYAVAMRYWTNGVADDLKMDFGDFIMAGKLTQFSPTAHPC